MSFKGKKHLINGESDTSGYIIACCGRNILIKNANQTKRNITCKQCLKSDDKYG